MSIVAWAVFGLIAGALAKFLMPGKDGGGCLVTVGLGIAGAVVGGLVGTRLGFGSVSGFNIRSFGLAVAGALVVLLAYRTIKGK